MKIRKKDVLLQPQMKKYCSLSSWGSRIVAIATDCKSVRVSVRWFESTLPHVPQFHHLHDFRCFYIVNDLKKNEFFEKIVVFI